MLDMKAALTSVALATRNIADRILFVDLADCHFLSGMIIRKNPKPKFQVIISQLLLISLTGR